MMLLSGNAAIQNGGTHSVLKEGETQRQLDEDGTIVFENERGGRR